MWYLLLLIAYVVLGLRARSWRGALGGALAVTVVLVGYESVHLHAL